MKTKQITVSAALTALNLLYIWLIPTIDLGVWSFTPFSHVPLFIGLFISPYVGVMTCIATFFGFVLKTANYIIWLRAASHLIFVAVAILFLKTDKLSSIKKLVLFALIIALVHSVAEIAAIFVGVLAGFTVTASQMTAYYILVVAGLGTVGHSIIDFFTAYVIIKPLVHAKLFFNLYGTGKGLEPLLFKQV